MIGPSCGLVIVEYYGFFIIGLTAAVYPHIAVGPGTSSVMDDFKPALPRFYTYELDIKPTNGLKYRVFACLAP